MMRPVREERMSSALAEGSGGGMQYLPERDVKNRNTIFIESMTKMGLGKIGQALVPITAHHV